MAEPKRNDGGTADMAEMAVISIRLDTVLWLALLGLALALRLASLDKLPLSVGESTRAFAAWVVSEGTVPDNWPGDLTAAFTAHLFRLFGPSDIAARIIPALAGSALVASLWYSGRYIGRGGALIAGALVAFSPLALLISRSALAFSAGALISLTMALSLFAYLREQRSAYLFLLALTFGLALGSDPVATSTAVILIAFLVLEGLWRRDQAIVNAYQTLKANPLHWFSALLILAGTFELAVTHFGTSFDRLSLSGLRQWAAMFEFPHDAFPWHYQLGLLLGYEWPLLLAGGAGFILLARRLAASPGQGLPLFQRFLLFWAAAAALIVAVTTRREAGQLLLLLLPLACLAGLALEEAASNVCWQEARRWWPLLLLALGLIAYAALLLTEWSEQGARFSGSEKAYLVLALFGVAFIVSGAFSLFDRDALGLALGVALALALPFILHSALAVSFNAGSEFAADTRLSRPQVEGFRQAVEQLVSEGGGPVAVDPALKDALGWHLRRSGIQFADVPPANTAAIVRPLEASEPAPEGFVPLGDPWHLGQGWYPTELQALKLWRWLAYRHAYGNLNNIDVQIFVPQP